MKLVQLVYEDGIFKNIETNTYVKAQAIGDPITIKLCFGLGWREEIQYKIEKLAEKIEGDTPNAFIIGYSIDIYGKRQDISAFGSAPITDRITPVQYYTI